MSLSHRPRNSYTRQPERPSRYVDAIDRAIDRLAQQAQRKGQLRPCELGGWLVDELQHGERSLTKVPSLEAGLILLCCDQGGVL